MVRLRDTPLMAPSITLPELVTGRPLTVAAASVPLWVVAKPKPAAAVPPTVMALALPLSFEISTRRSLMTLAETPTSVGAVDPVRELLEVVAGLHRHVHRGAARRRCSGPARR